VGGGRGGDGKSAQHAAAGRHSALREAWTASWGVVYRSVSWRKGCVAGGSRWVWTTLCDAFVTQRFASWWLRVLRLPSLPGLDRLAGGVAEAAPANFCCCRSCPLRSLRARGRCHRLRLAPFFAAKAGAPCVGVGSHCPRCVCVPGLLLGGCALGASRARARGCFCALSLPTCTPSPLARGKAAKRAPSAPARALSLTPAPPPPAQRTDQNTDQNTDLAQKQKAARECRQRRGWACRIQAMAIRDGLQAHFGVCTRSL